MGQQARQAGKTADAETKAIIASLTKFNVSPDTFAAAQSSMIKKNLDPSMLTEHIKGLEKAVDANDLTIEAAKSSLIKTIFDIMKR